MFVSDFARDREGLKPNPAPGEKEKNVREINEQEPTMSSNDLIRKLRAKLKRLIVIIEY